MLVVATPTCRCPQPLSAVLLHSIDLKLQLPMQCSTSTFKDFGIMYIQNIAAVNMAGRNEEDPTMNWPQPKLHVGHDVLQS